MTTPQDACNGYLACVAAAAPAVLGDAIDTYGTEGSCWTQFDAPTCAEACLDALAQLQEAYPEEPECVGGQGGSGGGPLVGWKQIASGGVHNCGINTDGTLICWGGNANGQSTPPGGSFDETRVSFYHSCGLGSDGALTCWGCQGGIDYGQCTVPGMASVTAFDAGTYSTCAVGDNGTATCWGCSGADYGQCNPPGGQVFTSVALGSIHACGLAGGAAVCWGNDEYGQASPPPGSFSQLSAGTWHTCGVRTDGTIACWGCNSPSPSNPANFGQCDAPVGSFAQVAVNVYHSCGLKSDGTVTCWGCIGDHDGNPTDSGQCSPPGDTFSSIGAGKWHGCGLRPDGSATCWGSDYYGQVSVP